MAPDHIPISFHSFLRSSFFGRFTCCSGCRVFCVSCCILLSVGLVLMKIVLRRNIVVTDKFVIVCHDGNMDFSSVNLMVQISKNILVEKIVARLIELRNRKGVSQMTAYHDTSINVARIESGKSANVSVSTLAKLCGYYGITLSSFMKSIGE